MHRANQTRIKRANNMPHCDGVLRIGNRSSDQSFFPRSPYTVGVAGRAIPRRGRDDLVLLDLLVANPHPVPERAARGQRRSEAGAIRYGWTRRIERSRICGFRQPVIDGRQKQGRSHQPRHLTQQSARALVRQEVEDQRVARDERLGQRAGLSRMAAVTRCLGPSIFLAFVAAGVGLGAAFKRVARVDVVSKPGVADILGDLLLIERENRRAARISGREELCAAFAQARSARPLPVCHIRRS